MATYKARYLSRAIGTGAMLLTLGAGDYLEAGSGIRSLSGQVLSLASGDGTDGVQVEEDLSVLGDLTVTGNVFVQGSRIEIDSTVSLNKDNLLVLSSEPSAAVDAGWLAELYYTAWGAADESDTAQDGGAATITLAAGASAADDNYNTWAIAITGGTGAGQQRTISDYNGTTKVATVDRAWDTQPDATSTYALHQTPNRYRGILYDTSEGVFAALQTAADPGAGATTVADYIGLHVGGFEADDAVTLSSTLAVQDTATMRTILPEADSQYDLGSDAVRYSTIYCDTIDAATSVIAGSTAAVFTVNSDAAAGGDEDTILRFKATDAAGETNSVFTGDIKLAATGGVPAWMIYVDDDGTAAEAIVCIGLYGETTAGVDAALLFSGANDAGQNRVLYAKFDAQEEKLTLGHSDGNATAIELAGAVTFGSTFTYNVGGSAFAVDASSVSLDATTSSNLTVTGDGQSLTLAAAGGGVQQAILSSAGTGVNALYFNASAGGIDIDFATGIAIDGAGTSNFTVDTGNLTLSTTTSGNLVLSAVGLMDINASASLDIDVTGTFDMLSSGAFSIDGTGASNLSATSGNLTLSTITSGDLILTAAGKVDASGGTLDVPAGTGFSIAGTALTTAAFTAANLDDLLDGSDASSLHTHTGAQESYANSTGAEIAAYELVYISGTNAVTKAIATSAAASMAIGAPQVAIDNGNSGNVKTTGKITAKFVAGLVGGAAPAAGMLAYVSKTAGSATTDVSGFTEGSDQITVCGVIADASGYAGAGTCVIQPLHTIPQTV
ncbi:MAG: hypothetical protein Q8R92_21145 [Deltaproteobacteria bacterium]|nr:hypothetical protein [Deltaproteobacteria bacterium]